MRAEPSLGRIALVVALLAACSCSRPATGAEDAALSAVPQRRPDCLDAAKGLLGPTAEIVKYGHLNGPEALEAVAIIRLGKLATTEEGIPVSSLVVLRLEASVWKPVLDVSKQITNAAGYIGIDYIDDSFVFRGYRLVLKNKRADGKLGITLDLSYLNTSGGVEGIPVEVSWVSVR